MSQFAIGDRVRCVSHYPVDNNVRGESGRVECIDSTGTCGVVFDNHISGHDLGGHCEYGYGWWLLQSELIFEEPEYEIDDTIDGCLDMLI